MSPLLAVGLLAGVGYAIFRLTKGSPQPPSHVEPGSPYPISGVLTEAVELVNEETGDSIAAFGTITILGQAAPGVLRVRIPNDPNTYRVSSDLVRPA